MPDVFFCADTHWGHDNIRKYCGRPFVTVDEMDEFLVQNWNSMVKPKDLMYFCGDFAFRDAKKALAIRKRLNGDIFFVEGNHDAAARKIKDTFAMFIAAPKHGSIGVVAKVGEQEILLSHYAHKTWDRSHHGIWAIHGHSHSTLPDDPHSLSVDVGVDAVAKRLADKRPSVDIDNLSVSGLTWREDYRPLAYDELKALMAAKDWKPVDHHGEDDEHDEYWQDLHCKAAQKHTQESKA